MYTVLDACNWMRAFINNISMQFFFFSLHISVAIIRAVKTYLHYENNPDEVIEEFVYEKKQTNDDAECK